jgi:hypothetical protein
MAARYELGDWGLTVSAERGRAWVGDNRAPTDIGFGQRDRLPTMTIGLSADRSFGDFDTSLGISWLAEDSTLLGAQFNPAFGVNGADTLFVDLEATRRWGNHWRFSGAVRAGLTQPRGGEPVADGSQLLSEAWSLDISRIGNFAAGDSLGFRLSQPMRVSGGWLALDLPVAYDYATRTPLIERRNLSLSPDGREIMGELAWGSRLLFGYASASLFYRSEPGHFADAPGDMGAVIRFNASF